MFSKDRPGNNVIGFAEIRKRRQAFELQVVEVISWTILTYYLED